MTTIYLAGAIDKNHQTFCREWRNEVEDFLDNIYGIKIINPIKGKDLNKEYDPDDIYYQDLNAVRDSDIIFAEMVLNRCYIGTAIELHHANMYNKDIIVWGRTHDEHYFIRSIMESPGTAYRVRQYDFNLALSVLKILIKAKEGDDY